MAALGAGAQEALAHRGESPRAGRGRTAVMAVELVVRRSCGASLAPDSG